MCEDLEVKRRIEWAYVFAVKVLTLLTKILVEKFKIVSIFPDLE